MPLKMIFYRNQKEIDIYNIKNITWPYEVEMENKLR